MTTDTRIQFRHMQGSECLDASIRRHADKLKRFYDHIAACEVTIEAPHHRRHKGFGYRVMVRLQVPGETIVVNRGDNDDPAHEDCYIAIHDAFRSARRRLQDYARIQRHSVKRHSLPLKPDFPPDRLDDDADGID